MHKFDLVVIGSGPGGYEVAIKASSKGLKVALIEKHEIGGTCLNYGCIPTKALYQSAKVLDVVRESKNHGINTGDIDLNFEQVINRKDEVVHQLKSNIKSSLERSRVEIKYGVATFVGKNQVEVTTSDSTEVIEFDHCIIASGSTEFILPIPGTKFNNVLTSKEMLSLTEIPKELIVIGGGVVGCEMASIFNQFGSQVTIIEALDKILNNFETDISNRLKLMMKKQGITIHTGTKVQEIAEDDGRLVVKCLNSKEKEVEMSGTHILMSVGRRAFVDHLNLDKIGIDYDRRGIKVNDNYETNVKNVYAVGDCIGGKMLAHTATFQSYKVLDTILNKANQTNFDVTPACVFTFPEVASVGLTEAQAKEQFEDIHVVKSLYRGNGKANAMGSVEGFIKLISHDDELLGVHILGEAASTIIHEASIMIDQKLKLSNVNSIHAHPTLSEVFLEALRMLNE